MIQKYAAGAIAMCLWLPGAAMSGTTSRSASVNFVLHCSGCHALDGTGNGQGDIPDFRNSVGAFARDDDGRTYLVHVPGVVNSGLSSAEIAAVMNFVLMKWGDSSRDGAVSPFTVEEVTKRLAMPVPDIVGLRRQIVSRLGREGILTARYPWP